MKTETWKKLSLTLPRLLEHANLDWRQLIVNQESGSLLHHKYPLSAKFFLSCAQKDFLERTPRGLINALSNAKRAIDCQTDSHICAIGLSPSELPKQLGKSGIADLSQFTREEHRPLTFRVPRHSRSRAQDSPHARAPVQEANACTGSRCDRYRVSLC